MPDKWEYPWYAAWDLAFHTVALAMVDVDFAKQQILLLLGDEYLNPNGQLPAYEWNFGDVNPPVHAWAAWEVYESEKSVSGQGDLTFLEEVFQKLLVNFNWWVNRKDPQREEHLRGRLPGARQHRRVRPQRPAAHGGSPGTGGRYRVDGLLQPMHAADRHRIGDA